MINISQIKEIAYDFEKKHIIFILKEMMLVDNLMRKELYKKGTYQDFCEYSKKLNNFKP